MSKQSGAKFAQGYRNDPNCCQRCEHFSKTVVEKTYEAYGGLKTWTEDKNMRCGIGGFAVKKMAVCDRFILRDDS